MQEMEKAVSKPFSRSAEFENVIREYGGLLWRTAGLYEYDPERRRDLHQEILLAVWTALPKFAGRSNLRTYLARIAHNKSVSHVAREAKLPRQTDVDSDLVCEAPGPEQRASHLADQARLQIELRRLALPSQQIVSLTLEGFAPREIADVLGLSANSVSIRLTRAKAALISALKE